MSPSDTLAAGLSTGLLAGPWAKVAMRRRTLAVLGRRRAPKWLIDLIDEVLAAYPTAPRDRPRELARYLQATDAWAVATKAWRGPHIRHLEPVPVSPVHRPWPVAELPTLAELAALLDLDQGELAWFADARHLSRHAPPRLGHYSWRALPQRGGAVRVVAAPKTRLKEIQRRLLRRVLDPIPVHPAAHGCVPGRGVRTALQPHSGARVVVRLDLRSFFPSVAAGRVWGVLRTAGLTEPVAHAITGLTTTVVPHAFWSSVARPPGEDPGRHRRLGALLAVPHLPQGAPTSPALANLIAFNLDRRLAALADRWEATYTRYVDDLTFSGDLGLGRKFLDAVGAIVIDEGFTVNDRKTVLLGSSGQQRALGCVVNDHPAVARTERDALRATLHNCAVRGWESQARGRTAEQFRAYLTGRISWVASLDRHQGDRLRAIADHITWPTTELAT
jgi:hypothetical protein